VIVPTNFYEITVRAWGCVLVGTCQVRYHTAGPHRRDDGWGHSTAPARCNSTV